MVDDAYGFVGSSGVLTFEWLIGLLLGAVAISALARHIKVPYPIFLAVGGVLLAFLPSGPSWTLEPKLALALFVAPVLLDAAFSTSLRDLRHNWLPVSTLVFVAVGVTTAAVAMLAHWMRPEMPWAVAIALGAITAPPDATAAAAILGQINVPYRVQKILEGESLLNDASALLIYRVCVGLVAAEHMNIPDFIPSVAVALVGSFAAGYLSAQVWMLTTRRIVEAPSAIITQFAGTFVVWTVAERVGLSGILTIIAYAITIARSAPARTSARLRVSSYAVWETVVFVLNVLAFMLIGMQLSPIWSALADDVRFRYCSFAAAILAVVILVRIAWVIPFVAFLRAFKAHGFLQPGATMAVPTIRGGLVVAWCGMRGLVTLAAAFALPEDFPHRDLILLTAFAVVLGSLLLQGLTLRPLILALKFGEDDPVAREAARARAAIYRAALGAIENDPSEEAKILRLEYRAMLLRAESEPGGGVATNELPADPLRLRAIAAARDTLLRMRSVEEIGDDAFHQIEEELDRAELSAQT